MFPLASGSSLLFKSSFFASSQLALIHDLSITLSEIYD